MLDDDPLAELARIVSAPAAEATTPYSKAPGGAPPSRIAGASQTGGESRARQSNWLGSLWNKATKQDKSDSSVAQIGGGSEIHAPKSEGNLNCQNRIDKYLSIEDFFEEVKFDHFVKQAIIARRANFTDEIFIKDSSTILLVLQMRYLLHEEFKVEVDNYISIVKKFNRENSSKFSKIRM